MDVAPDVMRNRFSHNPVEHMRIEHYRSRLPTKTKIEVKIGREESASITVRKPNFFTLEIVIRPGMGSGVGSSPTGSGVHPELVAKSKTLAFEIVMQARFEKLSGGNYRTEELKNWAKWAFDQLEKKFSDSTPEQ